MIQIDLSDFINKHIIKRKNSMFLKDIYKNHSALKKQIFNKSILVIGGAGTIGSSFIKEILNFLPKKLVVVDTNENGLTELTRDLRSTHNKFIPNIYLTYPMNFGDSSFYKMFLNHKKFNIIANFAAHKHVRSEKDIYSIEAMIDNNIIKAKNFLEFLINHKPDHFFCVSTDKAANPVNVMGASKKIMEDLMMTYSKKIKITTARFANVAFSNGSLLEGFINRLNKNQPISCPEDIKRYFVSPEESGQICLLACILGKSSEIFYPKLSPNNLISFKEISTKFFKEINLNIKKLNTENEAKLFSVNRSKIDPYPVYYFKTNTSGEKLFEEFYSNTDLVDEKKFNSLGVIKNGPILSKSRLDILFDELFKMINSNNFNKPLLIQIFKSYLDNFNHIETGENLDNKM